MTIQIKWEDGSNRILNLEDYINSDEVIIEDKQFGIKSSAKMYQ